MNLVHALVTVLLFGPPALGVLLALVTAVLVRRSLRSSVSSSGINRTRHPRATLLAASVLWVAFIGLASWLGLLVAFGAAWTQAHVPRGVPALDVPRLLMYIAANALVLVAVAYLLGRFVSIRYRSLDHPTPKVGPSSLR